MRDVIVVGAGPSGLNVARQLAEKNLNVLVLEKKKSVGEHVICTGIVSKEAFDEFELSMDSILTKIQKIRWNSPLGNFVDYEHPNHFAYVVDRERFDKYLSYNVDEIELESEVVDVSLNDDSVEVVTKKAGKFREKYRARMIIIATGINYKLHKELDLGYPVEFLNGVQAEMYLPFIQHTHVFVGKDIAPGAFAWLVPMGEGLVRLGLMTEKDPMRYFDRLIEMFSGDKIEFANSNRIQFKAIAQGLVSRTYGNRVLALGEAAGQVKTTTGGGIYFGLLCSEIATKVVIKAFEKGNFNKDILAEYEKLWRQTIQKEIKIGYYARKICSKLNDHQIETLVHKAKTDGILPILRDRGKFDWHSELIFTLARRIPYWGILKNQLKKQ
jgi:geranylgeranyl reductase family protein